MISLGDNRKEVLEKYLSEEKDDKGKEVKWDIIRLKINKKEVDQYSKRTEDYKFDNTEEYTLDFIKYEKKIKDKRA